MTAWSPGLQHDVPHAMVLEHCSMMSSTKHSFLPGTVSLVSPQHHWLSAALVELNFDEPPANIL